MDEVEAAQAVCSVRRQSSSVSGPSPKQVRLICNFSVRAFELFSRNLPLHVYAIHVVGS